MDILDMKVSVIPIKVNGEPSDWNKFLEEFPKSVQNILEEGDVIVLASKYLLKLKRMYIDLNEISPSHEAYEISKKYGVDPRFAELIIKYSNQILGGVKGAILTYVDGFFVANAGIDRKNIGLERVSLPPTRLRGSSKEIYEVIKRDLGIRVGIIITDSVVYPLRMGTRLQAIEVYGFNPIRDYRGVKDIHGRKIVFTRMNIADEISSAAHLVMGEGDEKVPIAIVKGVKIELIEDDLTDLLKIKPEECLYKNLYPEKWKKRG